jgi:hypothetical protein
MLTSFSKELDDACSGDGQSNLTAAFLVLFSTSAVTGLIPPDLLAFGLLSGRRECCSDLPMAGLRQLPRKASPNGEWRALRVSSYKVWQ